MDWRFRLKRLFAFHPLYLLGLLLGAGTPLVFSGAFINRILLTYRLLIGHVMLALLVLLYWKPMYRGARADRAFRGSGWCSLGLLIGLTAVLLGAGTGTHTRWLYRSIFYTLILKDVIYLVRGRFPLWEVDDESEQQTGPER